MAAPNAKAGRAAPGRATPVDRPDPATRDQLLAARYYDLRYAEEHERLFGGLAVGRDPTPLAHRYFVLELDFSDVDPDPPPRGDNVGVTSRVERLGNEILWNDVSYVVHSEPEVDHRYADLCLLRRPDARASRLRDLLFEFKRLKLSELGMRGDEVKAAPREELAKLKPVKKALDEAEGQLRGYVQALERRCGKTLKLRAWAVVALGFERLVVRNLSATDRT